MSARLLATLVGLLSVAPCFGSPDLVGLEKRPVVVYLRTTSGQRAEPIQAMQREANALMETAGYHIEWRSLPGGSSNAVEGPIVVVELRGNCESPDPSTPVAPLTAPSALASTAVSDGEVLPFSWVECDTLSRMLAAPLSKYENKQEFLYGRAMGRLIAHELYHILTKTRHHNNDGVAKPRFSAADVLAEHFSFDTPTLAKLREPAGAAEPAELEDESR
ncbi:MAG: hypothetical protein JO307_31375 [Bryobacterales bacterium]|nr:hypothetical protein [Bryobacterales bacterium]MBV9397219.1 hypothetical protein [Bryobacterales bacterium]